MRVCWSPPSALLHASSTSTGHSAEALSWPACWTAGSGRLGRWCALTPAWPALSGELHQAQGGGCGLQASLPLGRQRRGFSGRGLAPGLGPPWPRPACRSLLVCGSLDCPHKPGGPSCSRCALGTCPLPGLLGMRTCSGQPGPASRGSQELGIGGHMVLVTCGQWSSGGWEQEGFPRSPHSQRRGRNLGLILWTV